MVFSANQEELFSKIKEERDDLGDHVIGQLFLPTVICILRESGGSNIILKLAEKNKWNNNKVHNLRIKNFLFAEFLFIKVFAYKIYTWEQW